MTIEIGSQTDRQLLTDFAKSGDEEAFAELVRRHGPMVLGICRHMLRNEQDAEDTFQATFLVLARKAESIRSAEALPNWLYSVATRLATRNRAVASRRHAREVPLVDVPANEPSGRPGRNEMWPVLCEEIGRLPERYRIPFILCYLDGKTNEEAAKELHCPAGTVFSRLSRARKRLRDRLNRRGLVVSSALLATTLAAWPRDASAAVATPLFRTTVRGAVAFSAGRAKGAAGISARVKSLAAQQLAVWSVLSLKSIGAALLAIALTGSVAGLVIWRTVDTQSSAVQPVGAKSAEQQAIAAKSIEEQLKGTWILDSMSMDGTDIDLGAPGRIRVVYGDNGKLNDNGAYKTDTGTKPMKLFWIFNGISFPTIFNLQGDSLTVCIGLTPNGQLPDAEPVPPAPTDFTPGKGKAVFGYSRQRP